MLEQAISAISCVFIGKLEGDARMLRQGVQLYNSCIRQMCQTLERKTYSDELLYASVIFQELEVTPVFPIHAHNGHTHIKVGHILSRWIDSLRYPCDRIELSHQSISFPCT